MDTLGVGHCKDTWGLGTSGCLGEGTSLKVGHCRDTWALGTLAWELQACALQGYLGVGHR